MVVLRACEKAMARMFRELGFAVAAFAKIGDDDIAKKYGNRPLGLVVVLKKQKSVFFKLRNPFLRKHSPPPTGGPSTEPPTFKRIY